MPAAKKALQTTLSLMSGAVFERGMAVERQITLYVRSLIQQGALQAGMRVPPIRTLAQAWGTNYFTVQTALRTLVKEGLLVQSPRLGTFVTEPKRTLQKVCLYHGEGLSFQGGGEFWARLHLHLYRMLAGRGVQTMSYFGRHDKVEPTADVPADIRQLVKDRQVDALILTARRDPWMERLDVPTISMNMPATCSGVSWDVASFVRLAVQAIHESGRRSLCLVTNAPRSSSGNGESDIRLLIEQTAARMGVTLLPPPVLPAGARPQGIEETGYMLGEQLAQSAVLPEALVISPDIYTRGIASAFLKHNVRVPDDVMLVSHGNQEMPLFTPFPVTWITLSIEDVAAALLAQVEQAMAGKRFVPIEVPVTLETP